MCLIFIFHWCQPLILPLFKQRHLSNRNLGVRINKRKWIKTLSKTTYFTPFYIRWVQNYHWKQLHIPHLIHIRATIFWIQRLSVLLRSGNATTFLRVMPFSYLCYRGATQAILFLFIKFSFQITFNHYPYFNFYTSVWIFWLANNH